MSATLALGNLTDGEDNSIKTRVANEHDALPCLVDGLLVMGNPNFPKQAARVLCNLASAKVSSLRYKMVSEGGAVTGSY